LDGLTNLRRLDVQSNRVVVMEGLTTLVQLTELYLSRNGITQVACLEVSGAACGSTVDPPKLCDDL
jgi:Leucine-rich repeat (LRR) protein